MATPHAQIIDIGSMAKTPKSKSEIEALLVLNLRSHEGCEQALQIIIVPVTDNDDAANWTVSRFDPGPSDADACDRALQHIVPGLQRVYELVQKH